MSQDIAFTHRGNVLTIQSHEVPKGGLAATVKIEQVAGGSLIPRRFRRIGRIPLRPGMRQLQGLSNKQLAGVRWTISPDLPG